MRASRLAGKQTIGGGGDAIVASRETRIVRRRLTPQCGPLRFVCHEVQPAAALHKLYSDPRWWHCKSRLMTDSTSDAHVDPSA